MNWFLGILGAVILFTLFALVKNYIPHDFSKTTYQRVVFIPGIKTPEWAVKGWEVYLRHHFKGKELVVIRDRYHYKNEADMLRMKSKVMDIIKDGTSTALITHSYGGIVAVASIQADKTGETNIERVVALAPAFDKDFRDLFVSQEQIGYTREKIEVPMVTLCGAFDTVVPCKSTLFPGAREGKKIWVEHMGFLLPQIFGGAKVLEEMR